MNELTLYYKQTCPYCSKVLHFMQEKDIKVELKSTENDDNRNELIQLGGKPQVPCLVIKGTAMYESDDIIQWFQENLAS